jgi:hypothetical protein
MVHACLREARRGPGPCGHEFQEPWGAACGDGARQKRTVCVFLDDRALPSSYGKTHPVAPGLVTYVYGRTSARTATCAMEPAAGAGGCGDRLGRVALRVRCTGVRAVISVPACVRVRVPVCSCATCLCFCACVLVCACACGCVPACRRDVPDSDCAGLFLIVAFATFPPALCPQFVAIPSANSVHTLTCIRLFCKRVTWARAFCRQDTCQFPASSFLCCTHSVCKLPLFGFML